MPSLLLSRARDLRKRQTDAERLLWRRLRARTLSSLKFRRQHPIGRYIVDFYCEQAGVAVEIDGGGHADEGQKRYDRRRTESLRRRQVRLLRFWNTDVLLNPDGVLERILEEVKR